VIEAQMKAAVTTALFLVTKHGASKSEAARRAVEKHQLESSKIEPVRARVQGLFERTRVLGTKTDVGGSGQMIVIIS